MKSLILLMCLPVYMLAQEPVRPVSQPVNLSSVDISALTKDVSALASQIKALSDVIKSARAQIQVYKAERDKLQSDLAAKKKERSEMDGGSAAANQLDRQIKDLETKIADLDKKITAQQEFITRQQAEISKLEDAIDKLQGKVDELQSRDAKTESNKAKNEAAPTYAKVKALIDALPAAEKAKLTASQLKTLNYYQNLHEKDAVFKTGVLAARLEAQREELDIMSQEKKDRVESSSEMMKAMMEMIRKYLETLAAMQSKIMM
jgi:chromosome segregation ATPase